MTKNILIVLWSFFFSIVAHGYFGSMEGCHTSILAKSATDSFPFDRTVHDLNTSGNQVLADEMLCYVSYGYGSCDFDLFFHDYRAVIKCSAGHYVDTTEIKSGTKTQKINKALKSAHDILKKSGFNLFSKVDGRDYYVNNKLNGAKLALFYKPSSMVNSYRIYELGNNDPLYEYIEPNFSQNSTRIFEKQATSEEDVDHFYEKLVDPYGGWFFDGDVGILIIK